MALHEYSLLRTCFNSLDVFPQFACSNQIVGQAPEDLMIERDSAPLRLPRSTLVQCILTGLTTQGYQNKLRETCFSWLTEEVFWKLRTNHLQYRKKRANSIEIKLKCIAAFFVHVFYTPVMKYSPSCICTLAFYRFQLNSLIPILFSRKWRSIQLTQYTFYQAKS